MLGLKGLVVLVLLLSDALFGIRGENISTMDAFSACQRLLQSYISTSDTASIHDQRLLLADDTALGVAVNQSEKFPLTERAFEGVALLIICMLAIGGNTTLWVVVIRTQDLQTAANSLLLCLSAADLLVSVVNMPLTVATIFIGRWVFSDGMCVATGFSNMLTLLGSVMSLCLITLNRYICVCRPHLHRQLYSRRAIAAHITGVWVLSAALSCPPLFGWSEYRYLSSQFLCFCYWRSSLSYTVFMVAFCFGGTSSLMTSCYVAIHRKFTRSKRVLSSKTSLSNVATFGGLTTLRLSTGSDDAREGGLTSDLDAEGENGVDGGSRSAGSDLSLSVWIGSNTAGFLARLFSKLDDKTTTAGRATQSVNPPVYATTGTVNSAGTVNSTGGCMHKEVKSTGGSTCKGGNTTDSSVQSKRNATQTDLPCPELNQPNAQKVIGPTAVDVGPMAFAHWDVTCNQDREKRSANVLENTHAKKGDDDVTEYSANKQNCAADWKQRSTRHCLNRLEIPAVDYCPQPQTTQRSLAAACRHTRVAHGYHTGSPNKGIASSDDALCSVRKLPHCDHKKTPLTKPTKHRSLESRVLRPLLHDPDDNTDDIIVPPNCDRKPRPKLERNEHFDIGVLKPGLKNVNNNQCGGSGTSPNREFNPLVYSTGGYMHRGVNESTVATVSGDPVNCAGPASRNRQTATPRDVSAQEPLLANAEEDGDSLYDGRYFLHQVIASGQDTLRAVFLNPRDRRYFTAQGKTLHEEVVRVTSTSPSTCDNASDIERLEPSVHNPCLLGTEDGGDETDKNVESDNLCTGHVIKRDDTCADRIRRTSTIIFNYKGGDTCANSIETNVGKAWDPSGKGSDTCPDRSAKISPHCTHRGEENYETCVGQTEKSDKSWSVSWDLTALGRKVPNHRPAPTDDDWPNRNQECRVDCKNRCTEGDDECFSRTENSDGNLRHNEKSDESCTDHSEENDDNSTDRTGKREKHCTSDNSDESCTFEKSKGSCTDDSCKHDNCTVEEDCLTSKDYTKKCFVVKNAENCTAENSGETCTLEKRHQNCTLEKGDYKCTSYKTEANCALARGAENSSLGKTAENCTLETNDEHCTLEKSAENCTFDKSDEYYTNVTDSGNIANLAPNNMSFFRVSSLANLANVTTSASLSNHSAATRFERRRREEMRLTSTILLVIFVYVISWLPYCVTILVNNFLSDSLPRQVDVVTLLMGYANSVYNPFIYGWRNGNIRRGYVQLFTDIRTALCYVRPRSRPHNVVFEV